MINTNKSFKSFRAVLFFGLILMVTAPFVKVNDTAFASGTGRLYVQSSRTTLTVDETFTASIIVDGGGQSFSSAQSTVSLTNLTVTGFTLGTAFAWWQTSPSASSLSFLGGMQGSTTNTTIYTLTLKAGSVGSASVNVSDSRIVGMVDGTAVDILGSQSGATYTIAAAGGGGTVDDPGGGSNPAGDTPADTGTGTVTPSDSGTSGSSSTTTSTPSTSATPLNKKIVTSTTYGKSAVTFDKTEAIANGTDKICLEIALINDAGKPITTTKPVVTSSADTTISELTKENNIWKTCLVSSTAGEKKVDVKAGSTTVSSTAISFTAPPVVATETETVVERTADSLTGGIIRPKSRMLLKDQLTDRDQITIEGRADPDSDLIVSIFSELTKEEVTSDADGNWSVTVAPLEAGDHRIEVAYADDQTLAAKTVTSFTVIKYPNYYLWGGVILGALVIIILTLWFIIKRRKKNAAATMNFTAPSEANLAEIPAGTVGSLNTPNHNAEQAVTPAVQIEPQNAQSGQTFQVPVLPTYPASPVLHEAASFDRVAYQSPTKPPSMPESAVPVASVADVSVAGAPLTPPVEPPLSPDNTVSQTPAAPQSNPVQLSQTQPINPNPQNPSSSVDSLSNGGGSVQNF